jgi:hypothetical protein
MLIERFNFSKLKSGVQVSINIFSADLKVKLNSLLKRR